MEAITIGGLILLAASIYIDREEYLHAIREDCRDIAQAFRELFTDERRNSRWEP